MLFQIREAWQFIRLRWPARFFPKVFSEPTVQGNKLLNRQQQIIALLRTRKHNETTEHPSLFLAGWRPYIGWVGGSALAYELLFRPIINGLLMAFGLPAIFAELNIELLQTTVMGLLGLGLARSWDKANGRETNQLRKRKEYEL